MRWMALENVSLQASFKYRWAEPSFRYNTRGDGAPISFTLSPIYHLFSGQFGVAYHFWALNLLTVKKVLPFGGA